MRRDLTFLVVWVVWNGRYLNLFYCLLIKCFGRFFFFSFLFGFLCFLLVRIVVYLIVGREERRRRRR